MGGSAHRRPTISIAFGFSDGEHPGPREYDPLVERLLCDRYGFGTRAVV